MPSDERNAPGSEDERASLNGTSSHEDDGPSLARQIHDLASALRNTDVGELDLTEDGVRITLSASLSRRCSRHARAARCPSRGLSGE